MREEIKLHEAKVISLKQQLNKLHDEIKHIESEYGHQCEAISAQKKILAVINCVCIEVVMRNSIGFKRKSEEVEGRKQRIQI